MDERGRHRNRFDQRLPDLIEVFNRLSAMELHGTQWNAISNLDNLTDGLIDEHVRTRNVRASPAAYEIDPGEHIAARKRLRAGGRSILGAYHSHPRSAASPSATDIAEAFYDENFVYVIVSLAGESPDVRVYHVEQRDLVAIDFEPVP